MFTPAKVKADILFGASLIAVFGFSLPDSVSVALIAAAGLIAAALNFGDTLVQKYDPKLITAITTELVKLERSASGVIPLLLPVLNALPGKIGKEIAEALEKAEKGPSTEVETSTKIVGGKAQGGKS